MNTGVHILGITGSLRKGSYNRGLLPPDTELEIFDLVGIPAFNQDLETSMPDAPRGLKTRIEGADAILLMTPEHDFSYSGVLKNTIDWASRPPGSNSFVGKPGAIMSASTGVFGGARAQYHLRQVLAGMNMYLRNKPEVMVTMARDKFDQEGTLTDGKTLDHVKALLEAFVSWVKRLRGDAV